MNLKECTVFLYNNHKWSLCFSMLVSSVVLPASDVCILFSILETFLTFRDPHVVFTFSVSSILMHSHDWGS